ncbi:hypothetical protein OG2516_18130 [Oceanicola granulosus HTCC2516]|uniref:Uncharacterized protein n=1 Tax=Oceanicola granulosus (strain ATCC BAA-861 / DSM 15982 / KCTC 12143 / HTCC2516) TaxID=314256 RepID=Q2CEL8_OCEGH|nr:hypothetical protein [Oceanicola granulosus]EAR51114.1 hypothetical protein OG2516_18130 [Oceanicola granulosus HTCC2516]
MKPKSLVVPAALLALLALIGLIAVTYEYFTPASGIDHTAGALLAIAASALILGAALVVGFVPSMPAALHWTLEILLLLGLIGTLAAAWLLESWILVACMAVGLVIQILRFFQVKPLIAAERGRAASHS